MEFSDIPLCKAIMPVKILMRFGRCARVGLAVSVALAGTLVLWLRGCQSGSADAQPEAAAFRKRGPQDGLGDASAASAVHGTGPKPTLPVLGAVRRMEAGRPVVLPASVSQLRGEWKDRRFAEVSGGESPPLVPGHMARAWVVLPTTDQALQLSPNQAGEFPRIFCGKGERIQVVLQYEGLAPNTALTASVADGGTVDRGKPGASYRADGAGAVSFDFTASQQDGMHRILLVTADGDRKLLNIWAGQPPGFDRESPSTPAPPIVVEIAKDAAGGG